jgi:hypothetical protein
MATLRRRIVESLADYLGTGLGWEVTARGQTNDTTFERLAVVYFANERKAIRDGAGCSGGQYNCTLTVEVRVMVDPGLAGEDGNPFDLLDDAVAELEARIPWQSDLQPILAVPGVYRLDYSGHRPDGPDEDTGHVAAVMSLDVEYKHDLDNPSTFGGLS